MKTLKKLQSIILAAAMCFSCMAVLAATSVTAEGAPANDKSYVIWEAVPIVSKEKGGMDNIHLNRKSIWQDDSELQPNSMAVKSDEAGEYFEVTLGQNGGWGAVIRSGLTLNTKDYLGWLGDTTFINNVLPYLTLEAELCRFGDSAKNPSFDIGLMPLWSQDSRIPFLRANSSENFDVNNKRGEWIKVSHGMYGTGAFGNHLADGLFYVCAWSEGDDAVTEDNPVTIGIRNLRLVVKDKDRLAFNKALKDAEYTDSVRQNGTGSWKWRYEISFGSDEESNTDYFGAVIKYNDIAEYTTEKSYVIWEANPELVRDINKGTTINKGKNIELLAGGGLEASRAELKSEGNCYYYSLYALQNDNYAKNGIFLKTDFKRDDGKDKVGENFEELAYALGWVRFGEYIDLIAPYLTLKCDIRCTSEGNKSGHLKIGIAKDGNTDNVIEYINLSSENIVYSNTGNWVSIEGDYENGKINNVWGERLTFYVNAWGYDFDIKNLRLEIKEKDRLTVNNLVKDLKDPWAVSQGYDTPIKDSGHYEWTQGEWTTDDNGNVDFFARMITFDSKLSKSGLNVLRGDLNKDGKRDICDLVALKKYATSLSTQAPLPYKNINIVDCNRDGKVDNSDLSPLRKVLL